MEYKSLSSEKRNLIYLSQKIGFGTEMSKPIFWRKKNAINLSPADFAHKCVPISVCAPMWVESPK